MVLMFCMSSQVLYIFERFHENISNDFQLTSSRHEYMVEMAMFNVQRAITPKVDNQNYGSCVLHIVISCFIFV